MSQSKGRIAVMHRDRWRILRPLLDQALMLSAEEQVAWLAELRARSPELAGEVISLLARESAADREAFLAAAPAMPMRSGLIGLQLDDHYAIEREIGHGGMATVYLARDLRHRRAVAIKVLHLELSAAIGAERFLREIELTASLQHPHILPLFDSGSTMGLLYYVMPFVEGETLRDRLVRERQLPVEESVRLTRQVADALSYAHGRGVVHRDIKPENILLAGHPNGVTPSHALVADFGIALALEHATGERLTRGGLSLGTPQYMAPEQITGETPIDPRTDVYALGTVLYEMLAGEPPFTGPTAQAVLTRVAAADPKPLERQRRDVPPRLNAVVCTALEKRPADRFPSAELFATALVERTAGASVKAATPRMEDHTPRFAPRLARFAIVSGLVLVAVVGFRVSGLWIRVSGEFRTPPASVAVGQRSVAVLPFENVGGDPAEEYFSDGLTDELTAALSQIRSLRVAARTSAFALKGQARDIREIARALNVGAVLVGSVRKSKTRIRVTAQLIDASTGLGLWSGSYDERKLSDIFDIQADLALRIAHALESNLTPAERGRLTRRPTENLEAYTLYLKGRFAWAQRDRGLLTALEYFKQAIAVDPQYARAHAGIASVYGPLGVLGYIRPKEGREGMRDAVRKAVELDDSLSEAHTVQAAYLHVYEWNWPRAEREFQRAIDLDPNQPTAHAWYGYLLENLGRFDEAISERERALELDPLAPEVTLGGALRKAGRYHDARRAFRDVIARYPNNWPSHEGVGLVYELTGELDDAIREFELAVTFAGPTQRPKAGLARVLALSGRTADAQRLIRELYADAARTGIYHPVVAAAVLATGDRNGAIAWLERSYGQRHPALVELYVDGRFASLRGDRRFDDLLRRVGFTP